jgi:hypothetical protein
VPSSEPRWAPRTPFDRCLSLFWDRRPADDDFFNSVPWPGNARGDEPGLLMYPMNKDDNVQRRRMTDQVVYDILRRLVRK